MLLVPAFFLALIFADSTCQLAFAAAYRHRCRRKLRNYFLRSVVGGLTFGIWPSSSVSNGQSVTYHSRQLVAAMTTLVGVREQLADTESNYQSASASQSDS